MLQTRQELSWGREKLNVSDTFFFLYLSACFQKLFSGCHNLFIPFIFFTIQKISVKLAVCFPFKILMTYQKKKRSAFTADDFVPQNSHENTGEIKRAGICEVLNSKIPSRSLRLCTGKTCVLEAGRIEILLKYITGSTLVKYLKFINTNTNKRSYERNG